MADTTADQSRLSGQGQDGQAQQAGGLSQPLGPAGQAGALGSLSQHRAEAQGPGAVDPQASYAVEGLGTVTGQQITEALNARAESMRLMQLYGPMERRLGGQPTAQPSYPTSYDVGPSASPEAGMAALERDFPELASELRLRDQHLLETRQVLTEMQSRQEMLTNWYLDQMAVEQLGALKESHPDLTEDQLNEVVEVAGKYLPGAPDLSVAYSHWSYLKQQEQQAQVAQQSGARQGLAAVQTPGGAPLGPQQEGALREETRRFLTPTDVEQGIQVEFADLQRQHGEGVEGIG